MCGKRQHNTFTEADEIARKMKNKKNELFIAYYCEECKAYHVRHIMSKFQQRRFHRIRNSEIK